MISYWDLTKAFLILLAIETVQLVLQGRRSMYRGSYRCAIGWHAPLVPDPEVDIGELMPATGRHYFRASRYCPRCQRGGDRA